MLASKTSWKFSEQIEDLPVYEVNGKPLSTITTRLLMQRGITSEEVEHFLYPRLEDIGDAGYLSMIDVAVQRVHDAISNEERILIYGDYDADGVTSTALLIRALRELGADCSYYIPNRFHEGYGPNQTAFQQAIDEGITLIITVDCGINAVEEVNLANEQQVDVIITDHHDVQDILPEAYAIIHPQLSDHYLCKDLAGVGVAFQFATEILQEMPIELLDFVAIGTIADLVPLQADNRILVYHGLHQIERSNHVGLQILLRKCQIDGKVTSDDVGFSIAPRINAVGRLQDASLAVELLLTTDQHEAEMIVDEIEALNDERKEIVNEIVSEAIELIPKGEHDVLFVAKEGWNEGVLGIVASHLVRKYERPAIVLSMNKEAGYMKGSARSIPAFHMFNHCSKMSHLFKAFGGHAQAAGMTIPLEHAEDVKERLCAAFRSHVLPEDMKQETVIHASVEIDSINEQMIDEISMLSPFGMGNPKPLFHVEHTLTDFRQIGAQKHHLKMQMEKNGVTLDCIAFQMGQLFWSIAPQSSVSLVGELGINEWNGNRKLQLRVEDIKINEWQLFDYRGKPSSRIDETHVKDRTEIILWQNESKKSHTFPYERTYEELLMSDETCDALYLMELPKNEHDLVRIVKQLQPKNIYVCFRLEQSSYLSTFTSREDFKWIYSVLYQNRQIDLKQFSNAVIRRRNWTKDRMEFIFNVFLELEFVTMKNGTIIVNPKPSNRDLTESPTFSARIQKEEMERTFYYSSYSELHQWFSLLLGKDDEAKGEVTNEFERLY